LLFDFATYAKVVFCIAHMLLIILQILCLVYGVPATLHTNKKK